MILVRVFLLSLLLELVDHLDHEIVLCLRELVVEPEQMDELVVAIVIVIGGESRSDSSNSEDSSLAHGLTPF